MSFGSLLSFNIREVIFSFLSFSDIKSLIFLNRKICIEAMMYLKNQSLSIKQNEIYFLEKNHLINFLNRLPNITRLQINCSRVDIIAVVSSFPKKLKALKLIDISIRDAYNPVFWEDLAEVCSNLETFTLIVSEDLSLFWTSNRKPDPTLLFSKNHNLRKVALKYNKNDAIGIHAMVPDFMTIFYEAVARSSKAEILVLHYIVYEAFRFNVACPNIKEIRIKYLPEIKFMNYAIFRDLYDLYPNVESVYLYYYGRNKESTSYLDSINSGFDLLVENFLKSRKSQNFSDEKKSSVAEFKNFNLHFYGFTTDINQLTMINFISNNTKLRSFSSPSNKQLSTSIIQELLMRNPNLTQLNFDYTNFDDLSCQVLADSSVVKNLTKLSLQFCKRISHEGFALILENCASLKSLNVKGNKNFKNKTVEYLLNCGEIEELLLHENRIKNASFHLILKRFRKSLKILEISKLEGYEKFTNHIFKELYEEKFRISRLKVLDVAFNHIIDSSSIKYICEIFPNIERFNVKCCGHFNLDCFDIIKKTNWKNTLENLNMKYCHLFQDQIDEICAKLYDFKKLLHIFIEEDLCKPESKFSKRFIFCSN